MSEEENKIDKSKSLVDMAISLEMTAFVAILIGASYYLGWSYANGYFGRIGINHLSLALTTTYYLKEGFVATLPFITALISIYYQLDIKDKKTKIYIFLTNSLILSFVFSLLVPLNLSRIYILAVIVISILATWRGISLIEYFFVSKPLLATVIFAFCIFLLLSHRSTERGELDGKSAVEGNSSSTSGIIFTWKDNPLNEIKDKNLILIIHNNEKYYVVEKQNPAPDYPRAFIIPDEIVKYASTSSER